VLFHTSSRSARLPPRTALLIYIST